MGLFNAKPFIRNDKIPGQGKSVLQAAKKMNLRVKELDRLYHEYIKFEDKTTHLIEIKSLFNYYKINYTLFDSILFQFFDLTKCGYMNFHEFVVMMWAILSTDDDGLANLCFTMMDKNKSNSLHIIEVKYLINIIWEFKPSRQTINAMHKVDQNKDGFMTMPEFVLLSRHYPDMLHPVKHMKKSFQKVIVNWGFWKLITPRRLEDFGNGTVIDILEIFDPRYVPTSIEYLNLRTDIVPLKFIEQYNLIVRKKEGLKGEIELPYEIREMFAKNAPVLPTIEGLPPFRSDRSNRETEVFPAIENGDHIIEEKDSNGDDPNVVADTLQKVRIKGDKKQFLAA